MSDEVFMSQWVIYYNPSDFPGKYVLRRWDIYRGNKEPQPTRVCLVSNTLEVIRQQIPPGLYRLGRYENDDPVIVEVWI